MYEIRLVNKSTGKADTVLGDVETWTVSPVISDAGTSQFTYPRNGANWSAVQSDLDIAFFLQGVEVGSLRSCIEQISYDEASTNEEGDIATVTCRTSLARLERAVVYPALWPTKSDPPSQTFTGATAGFILRTLVQQAQLRGTIPEIDITSFTDTHDSAGNTWAQTISIAWNAQTTYLQIIQDLQSYGICDAVMNVYKLNLYNFQALGTDHTLQANPPIMRKGRDLTQSNFQASTRGLITVALTSGANNLYVEAQDTPAITTYGRREGGTSASGITDSTQLSQLGLLYAQSLASEVDARTNALAFSDPNTPMPNLNFDLGDWLWTDIDGTLHRQRVVKWSLASDNQGIVTGTAAMDTIFGEFLTRLQARVNGIESGAVIVGASVKNPVVKITSPPAVPTGLSVGSNAYIDNQGHTFAYIIASWAAVTQDQLGGTDTSIAGYQIQIKYSANSSWSAFSVDSATLSFYYSGLLPSTSVDVRVQCVDTQGNVSGWTTVDTITTAADVTPPNQPSTPAVASTLGSLSITWDGKDSGGLAMPGDFDHTVVYVSSTSPTFTPSAANQYATMRGGGTITVPGAVLTYGTTYYARFIAFDQTGNASTASTAGSATLAQVVTTDIGTGQVGLGNLSFSDVGNLVDNGSFEDANWRATRNTQFGGTHFAFDNTTSSAGTWSVVHTGTGGQTFETVVLNTVNCTVGQTFMGAADWKVSSAVTSGMRVAVGVTFRDVSGASLGYNDLSYCQTPPSTNDNTWRTRIFTAPATAPTGAVTAQFVFATSSHTAGSVWADNVEVRMQQDNLLIANAAITNAKINDMSANKITAGTISAGVILSGSIGTAASGQRCVMDGTGYHAYDSAGNLVFDVNNFNTILTLGAISANFKIQMDMSGTYPTIRFYDTSNSNNAFMNVTNVDGNTASFGINSGSFTSSGTLYRNRLLLWGPSAGCRLQVIDDATAAQDGGLLQLTPTSATYGLFTQASTHGGQLIFTVGGSGTDSQWQMDGFRNNAGSTAPQTQEAIFGGEIGSISGVGLTWSYGTTMFSTTNPVAVPRDINTSPVPGFMMTTSSTTGFGLIGSATYNGLFSVMFIAFRIR